MGPAGQSNEGPHLLSSSSTRPLCTRSSILAPLLSLGALSTGRNMVLKSEDSRISVRADGNAHDTPTLMHASMPRCSTPRPIPPHHIPRDPTTTTHPKHPRTHLTPTSPHPTSPHFTSPQSIELAPPAHQPTQPLTNTTPPEHPPTPNPSPHHHGIPHAPPPGSPNTEVSMDTSIKVSRYPGIVV